MSDYIHLMDLAEGHRDALDCLLAEAPQLLTLNLGSGQGQSVLEVVQAMEAAVSGADHSQASKTSAATAWDRSSRTPRDMREPA